MLNYHVQTPNPSAGVASYFMGCKGVVMYEKENLLRAAMKVNIEMEGMDYWFWLARDSVTDIEAAAIFTGLRPVIFKANIEALGQFSRDNLEKNKILTAEGIKRGELSASCNLVDWLKWGSKNDEVFLCKNVKDVLKAMGKFNKNDIINKSLADTGRAHVSNNLATLNQAATRFWANADRNDDTTHPINANVAAWLKDRGYSQTLAEKGATIIRPEWAGKGRKTDK